MARAISIGSQDFEKIRVKHNFYNPYLERAIMTGITRISKESILSDLNNLEVVTTTSKKYAECFGFTEEEVFAALEEYGVGDRKQQVKDWYDGCTGFMKSIFCIQTDMS